MKILPANLMSQVALTQISPALHQHLRPRSDFSVNVFGGVVSVASDLPKLISW